MSNFNDFVVHSSCFVLQDKRGLYKFTELQVNYAATPAPDDPYYCQDPFLISSKKRDNFFEQKINLYTIEAEQEMLILFGLHR